MPTSTSTGRAVRDVLNDPDLKRKKGKTPKDNFCKVVDKHLKLVGNDLIFSINNKNWQDVYTHFTEMRRFIEIKEESCK